MRRGTSTPAAAAAPRCTDQHRLSCQKLSNRHVHNFITRCCVSMQLVDAVYVIMAWATATNLANASGNLHIETWKDAQSTVRSFVSNNIWRAPIAACALGGLMVVLFNLMSCIVLLRWVSWPSLLWWACAVLRAWSAWRSISSRQDCLGRSRTWQLRRQRAGGVHIYLGSAQVVQQRQNVVGSWCWHM